MTKFSKFFASMLMILSLAICSVASADVQQSYTTESYSNVTVCNNEASIL